MTGNRASILEFCSGVLLRGDLASKLAAPPVGLDLEAREAPVEIDAPARDPGIALTRGSSRLPALDALRQPAARAKCLARFAHHELMAVELFAWALLRWPDVPTGLRRDWLAALREEQIHCGLYLERLAAHGIQFDDFEHSDYFWRQAPTIAASPAGARAFLAGIGLTLEQANLDFSAMYRDAFRRAGDEESAGVCQRVHDDEIRHVGHAYHWLRELAGPEPDAVSAYCDAVPFPLSGARAKGRRFHVAPRERAGLAPELISHVRDAGSSTDLHPNARSRS